MQSSLGKLHSEFYSTFVVLSICLLTPQTYGTVLTSPLFTQGLAGPEGNPGPKGVRVSKHFCLFVVC